jgi:hypothetical protein
LGTGTTPAHTHAHQYTAARCFTYTYTSQFPGLFAGYRKAVANQKPGFLENQVFRMMQTVVTRSIFKLSILVLFVTLFTAVPHLHARPVYAVELISFTGSGLPNGVRLTWETATEQSVSGFILQRSQGGGDFVDLTELYDAAGQPYLDGIIEAQGSPTLGATYIADDFTAVPGQTYTYQLVEIEGDNNLNPLEMVTVTAGGQPTATQLTIGTPIPTSPPQNTPTSTPQTSPTAEILTASATATRPLATAVPPQATASNNTNPQAVATGVPPSDGAIPLPEPISPPNELDNVVLAQTLETPTTDPYPGTDTTSAPEAYPEGATTSLPASEASATAYPASAFTLKQEPTPTIIGVIGGNDGSAGESGGTAVQTSTASSTGLLWIGFLGGLLIFIAAIAGSILLFVRHRE